MQWVTPGGPPDRVSHPLCCGRGARQLVVGPSCASGVLGNIPGPYLEQPPSYDSQKCPQILPDAPDRVPAIQGMWWTAGIRPPALHEQLCCFLSSVQALGELVPGHVCACPGAFWYV